jgi:hypothetical protein
MAELFLTRTSAPPPGSRQEKLVRVQVQGFSWHTGIYESCRLGCVINEELLEEEARSLFTDNPTTMLGTAMFNRKCETQIYSLLLQNTKHLATKRQEAQMAM